MFPKLQIMARKYMCIQATSVPSEQYLYYSSGSQRGQYRTPPVGGEVSPRGNELVLGGRAW